MYNPNFWNYGAKIITNYELRMLNDELFDNYQFHNDQLSKEFSFIDNYLQTSVGNVHTIFEDAYFQQDTVTVIDKDFPIFQLTVSEQAIDPDFVGFRI